MGVEGAREVTADCYVSSDFKARCRLIFLNFFLRPRADEGLVPMPEIKSLSAEVWDKIIGAMGTHVWKVIIKRLYFRSVLLSLVKSTSE